MNPMGKHEHAGIVLALAIAALAVSAPVHAQPLVRVPGDVATLQQAIHRVANGGVIELAGGTYPTPADGFRISNERKAFTVRSAPGTRAVLDGGGARPLLSFVNGNRGAGRPVRFERLTFRNGFAGAGGGGPKAGGVTVRAAEALFVDCVFEDNGTDSGTVGGALSVGQGSEVTIQGGAFRRNSTSFAGGAVGVFASRLTVSGARFTANRTNLPGHAENGVGGALFVVSGEANVTDSIFERNQAALVGGAIYLFGVYGDDPSAPGPPDAVVRVTRSTFRDNVAVPDPCCDSGAPTGGGAIHAEDDARVEIDGSWFVGNRGRFGGAVQAFRAELEITGSVFEGNAATQPGQRRGPGGAVAALSSAGFSEPGPNLPTAAVAVRDSLFLGLPGGGPAATQGGCLQASGDRPELEAGRGGLAANRVPLVLERVAFAGCRAEGEGTPSFGGAVAVEMADLAGRRVLAVGSSATGGVAGGGRGGVLSSRIESVVDLRDSTFAGNRAGFGGALYAADAPRLDVTDSRFFENRAGDGTADPPRLSDGASIFSQAQVPPSGSGRPTDARGTVAGSLFAADQGLSIRDQRGGGGRNAVRYDGNDFFPTAFGSLVYGDDLAAPDGLDPADLNALVIPGSPPVDKSTVPNRRLVSRPSAGDLLIFPAAGAAADASPARAVYAWSGFGATLVTPAGQRALSPSPRHGVTEIAAPGRYSLRVDGGEVAADTLAAPPPPLPPGPFLATPAVPGFRFKVRILAAGSAVEGRREPGCIAETLCVSGALPGRSEVFLRVVGPKPNGFLQPTLVKFSTSRVRIWIEQTATGAVRFYELEPVSAGDGRLATLDGLIDRTGFLPAGAAGAPLVASSPERLGGAAAADALAGRAVTGPPPPIPPGGRLTSPAFPGFRFTVRISAAGSSRLGSAEGDCLAETLCVSGALPGRSEVFLRVVGPKPNGFLQPTIVTFSTSTIEVWIERPATGDVRYYRIDGLAGGAGDLADLDGAIDREGFLP